MNFPIPSLLARHHRYQRGLWMFVQENDPQQTRD